MTAKRVVAAENAALMRLLDSDDRFLMLGEDIVDPYGGAFKVTRGLSTAHPTRVLNTPISESAMVGVALGLALQGNRVCVEIMFGDFLGLCFDQLVNLLSKSVSMYGHRLELSVVVRCPVGGGRGYGATHSQNLQKHFVGVPHLSLFELSPLHNPQMVLDHMFTLAEPCLLFEDKAVYGQRLMSEGAIDDVFWLDHLNDDCMTARVRAQVGRDAVPDCVLIAPGGLTARALAAMRKALFQDEMLTELIVPAQLYPFDTVPVLPAVRSAGRVCVLEDGVAGGTWGQEVASALYPGAWTALKGPILGVHPPSGLIPAARQLEKEFELTSADIYRAIVDGVGHG